MKTAEYNELVRRAARERPLPGLIRSGGGSIRHRWGVTVEREDEAATKAFDFGINPLTGRPYFSAWVFSQPGKSASKRLYRVYVGSGCVNEEPATIEYLAKGDPRGWQMPAGYGPYLRQQRIFGPKAAFVDRPLWDGPEKPFIYLTAPTADGKDLGGFVKTADRRRPQAFRTADAWDRELYQASVYVTISPYVADPSAVSIRLGGARDRRWRVLAGKAPSAVIGAGVAGIASQELAKIWLLRTPGDPEADEVFVQQVCFWDLQAKAIINLRLLELIGITAEVTAAMDIGLLALGLTGIATAAVLVGIQEAVVALILANLEAIIAAVSGVAFWTV